MSERSIFMEALEFDDPQERAAYLGRACGDDQLLRDRVEALLQTRFEARQAKDWATADKIRDELNALKVVVMDGPDGATWRLAEKPVEAS